MVILFLLTVGFYCAIEVVVVDSGGLIDSQFDASSLIVNGVMGSGRWSMRWKGVRVHVWSVARSKHDEY